MPQGLHWAELVDMITDPPSKQQLHVSRLNLKGKVSLRWVDELWRYPLDYSLFFDGEKTNLKPIILAPPQKL